MKCCGILLLTLLIVSEINTISLTSSEQIQVPSVSLDELSKLIKDGHFSLQKFIHESNMENEKNGEIIALETDNWLEQKGENAAFIRYVRKSYFFLLMYFPNLIRLFEGHGKLVEKLKPRPKPDPVQPSIFLQLDTLIINEEEDFIYEMKKNVEENEIAKEKLQEIHTNMIALIELTSQTSLQTTGFYNWLCRILIWIYRWFLFYGRLVARNLLLCRFWQANKEDDKIWVFRPQWRDRWEKFLQCRGNERCLYGTAPSGSSSGGSGSGSRGPITSGTGSKSGVQGSMIGAHNAGFNADSMSVEDDSSEQNAVETPFDFKDCAKYEDCEEETTYKTTMKNYNGTYTLSTSNSTTNSTATPTTPTTTTPTTTTAQVKLIVEKQEKKLINDDQQKIEKAKWIDNERKESISLDDGELSKLKQMEHSVVSELRQADKVLHDDMIGFKLQDSPKHSVIDDIEDDGLGEVTHVLQGIPEEVWEDLPEVMKREEMIGDNRKSHREGIEPLIKLSEVSEIDEHTEKVRPK